MPRIGAGPSPAAVQRERLPRRAVHGVLLLDKPVGLTSTQALGRVRRLLGALKGGHTGTLDPLASGLLPLAFGAATKFAQVSLEADKGYRAWVRLGQTREGGDLEGAVLEERPVTCSAPDVSRAAAALEGPLQQTPPMRSALKHEGRPLYAWARDGVEIERPARDVVIHAVRVVEVALPELTLDVSCSKGTYIRTLAEQLGAVLGCGAHLSGLRRTASGALRLADAVTLDAFEAMTPAQRDACLVPPDVLLGDAPALALDAMEAARFLTGLRRRVDAPDAPLVRVYGPDPWAFLGSGHVHAGELIPSRLLSPPEVEALRPAAASGESRAPS